MYSDVCLVVCSDINSVLYFDKEGLPDTPFNRLAEVGLVLLFTFLAAVYGWAVWESLR